MGYELGSTQDLITGFDQEAAAVVMAHKVLFKMVSIVKPSFKVSLPKEVEVVELPKSVKPDAHFVMKLLMGNSNYRQWLPNWSIVILIMWVTPGPSISWDVLVLPREQCSD